MYLTTFIVTFLLAGDANAGCSGEFKAFFIPFEHDTLYGMDERSIETGYDLSSLLKGKASRKALRELLERRDSPDAPFSGNAVRLKLVDGRDVWLVDQKGRVRHGGRSFGLNPRRFFELKDFLFANLPRPPEPRPPKD